MRSAAFIICVEDNHTAMQGVLLARSLRAFGGHYSDLPLIAFSPRGRHPSPDATGCLVAAGVQLADGPVNGGAHREIGYANKVIAFDWAERHLGVDRLIFVDSDSLILNDPAELVDSRSILLTPVWAKGLGSTGPSDSADAVWKRAGALAWPPAMSTRVTGAQIRPYFNSGLVASDRDAGLGGLWLAALNRLAADADLIRMLSRANADALPYFTPRSFLDQLALACAVQQVGVEAVLLGSRFNSPLHYVIAGEVDLSLDARQVVHAQHQGYPGWPQFAELARPLLGDEVARWLTVESETLPEPDLEWPPTFLQRFDFEMEAWREELRTYQGSLTVSDSQPSPPTAADERSFDFFLVQYSALREEIMALMVANESRTFTAFGLAATLWAVLASLIGDGREIAGLAFLLPVPLLLLAFNTHTVNGRRVANIGSYLAHCSTTYARMPGNWEAEIAIFAREQTELQMSSRIPMRILNWVALLASTATAVAVATFGEFGTKNPSWRAADIVASFLLGVGLAAVVVRIQSGHLKFAALRSQLDSYWATRFPGVG